jgi:Ca-activated chloride channel homolog
MYKLFFSLIFLNMLCTVKGQTVEDLVQEGNKQYANQDFSKAVNAYKKAVQQDGKNYAAQYNLAAGLFKQKKYEEAATVYNSMLPLATTNLEKANILYNAATALAKLDKLEEAVEKFKAALKQNETDMDCRHNLTKALQELQKKKQQQKSQTNPKPDPNKQDQPKQSPSKYNAQQIDQVLQMLRRKEQEVQKRLKNQQKPGLNKPEKDW